MLAIVIPYYRLDFLEETLNSLANQINRHFKVYIGDDASPDDPKPLLGKFANTLSITYKRFEENLGGISLVQHWDRCIEMTKDEEWLMILGDDDYLDEDVVEKWYNQFNIFANKTNVVRISTVSVDQKSKVLSEKFVHPAWESAADSYFRRFLQHTRSSLSEYTFRRTSYEKHRFYNFPLAWFTDNRAWLDFSESKPIYTINDAVVYIRTSQFNISGRTDNLELKREALLQFYNYLMNSKLNSFKKEQRLKLLRYYEDRLREKEKGTFTKKVVLIYFYLKNYNSHDFSKFIKRLAKSFLKRDSLKNDGTSDLDNYPHF